MKSNKTRERILDASLALFNEKKASNVSTVQISAAMKISPGNLYYYFANKEELIRCIWKERMLNEIGMLFAMPGKINGASDFIDFFEGCFKHYAKYKFFYTEISTLFVNDKMMMELYEETSNNMVKTYMDFFSRWIKEGKIKEMTSAELLATADNCIILSYKTTAYCDLVSDGGKGFGAFTRAAWFHILALLSQFLSEDMKSAINAELKNRGFDKNKYLDLRMKNL